MGNPGITQGLRAWTSVHRQEKLIGVLSLYYVQFTSYVYKKFNESREYADRVEPNY